MVNAGGVIHGAIVDVGGGTLEEAATAARGIGPRLAEIYKRANSTGSTPLAVATGYVDQRIAQARLSGGPAHVRGPSEGALR